ncbi:10901_t:CDS:2, partial [Acaulospora morrowiae]
VAFHPHHPNVIFWSLYLVDKVFNSGLLGLCELSELRSREKRSSQPRRLSHTHTSMITYFHFVHPKNSKPHAKPTDQENKISRETDGKVTRVFTMMKIKKSCHFRIHCAHLYTTTEEADLPTYCTYAPAPAPSVDHNT